MEAGEFAGGVAHGGDVEVAFALAFELGVWASCVATWGWSGGVRCGCECGLGEEVAILAFFAGEASGEVGWWGGTPG